MKLIKVMDADGIENGVWFEVNAPGTTDPLFRDPEETLPCRVKVRSDKSKSYREATFQFQQRLQQKLNRAKAKDREALQQAAFAEQRQLWFSELLVATENCDAEKAGIVTPTKADMLALAEDSENLWFVEQVVALGLGEKNFPALAGNGDGAKAPASKTKS